MNGSKAKSLRGLAGVQKGENDSRVYGHIKHTVRIKQAKDFLGNIVATVKTATLVLDPQKSGERGLYKTIKRGYKSGLMRPAW